MSKPLSPAKKIGRLSCLVLFLGNAPRELSQWGTGNLKVTEASTEEQGFLSQRSPAIINGPSWLDWLDMLRHPCPFKKVPPGLIWLTFSGKMTLAWLLTILRSMFELFIHTSRAHIVRQSQVLICYTDENPCFRGNGPLEPSAPKKKWLTIVGVCNITIARISECSFGNMIVLRSIPKWFVTHTQSQKMSQIWVSNRGSHGREKAMVHQECTNPSSTIPVRRPCVGTASKECLVVLIEGKAENILWSENRTIKFSP